MEIPALDPRDTSVAVVKVAGPAALVVAKLVQLAERISGPRAGRVLAKDASDVLRLLRYTDAATIGRSLAVFARDGAGSGTIELAVEYHQQFETGQQITVSFRTLTARLLDTYDTPTLGQPD